jgi:hypothetical protein
MSIQKNSVFAHLLSCSLLLAALLVTAVLIRVPPAQADIAGHSMQVYKSPNCGCCTAWVEHMRKSSFDVTVKHPKNLNDLKKQLNIHPKNQACHTSIMQGYTFEGHIPANVIQQFIKDKPKNSTGLAVPGMPMGSPGMDTDKHFKPYQVFLLKTDGTRTPYAEVSSSTTVFLGSQS